MAVGEKTEGKTEGLTHATGLFLESRRLIGIKENSSKKWVPKPRVCVEKKHLLYRSTWELNSSNMCTCGRLQSCQCNGAWGGLWHHITNKSNKKFNKKWIKENLKPELYRKKEICPYCSKSLLQQVNVTIGKRISGFGKRQKFCPTVSDNLVQLRYLGEKII